MAQPERFGIRVVHHGWAGVNGGCDVVGSHEEMEALAAKWDQHPRSPHETLIYKVERYTGDDPAEQNEVRELLAREGVSGGGG